MNFCHFKIGRGGSEDKLLISTLLLDLLFLLIVKAVLEGAGRKVQKSDGSAVPFPVLSCLHLTDIGRHGAGSTCFCDSAGSFFCGHLFFENKTGILLWKLKCNSSRLAFFEEWIQTEMVFLNYRFKITLPLYNSLALLQKAEDIWNLFHWNDNCPMKTGFGET